MTGRKMTRWDLLPVVGLVFTIGLQILWPLTGGASRATLTVVIVLIFAATSVTHAAINLGWRWTAPFVTITYAFAWAIEAIGTSLGFPFGAYDYGTQLGPTLFSVPLIVPLAWLMMAYPVVLVSRRLALAVNSRFSVLIAAAIGAFAMTAWDFFLDPQMVGEGYWTWVYQTPAMPGLPGIPLTNFAGWLGGSFILMLALHVIPWRPTREPVNEWIPGALWIWTWIGGIVANAFFLGRPSVALVGGIAMGIVTVPYVIVSWRAHRSPVAANEPTTGSRVI